MCLLGLINIAENVTANQTCLKKPSRSYICPVVYRRRVAFGRARQLVTILEGGIVSGKNLEISRSIYNSAALS